MPKTMFTECGEDLEKQRVKMGHSPEPCGTRVTPLARARGLVCMEAGAHSAAVPE